MKNAIKILLIFCLFVLPATAKSFSDVNDKTSYSDSIMWMAYNGVIKGDAAPKTTFRPDDCVNRAEMLKMLFEATGEDLNDMAMGGTYPDVPGESWYFPYVKKATLKGIVQGYPDGNFRPEKCVNRAEAMKMAINEFEIEFTEGNKISSFKDIDNREWYFDYANTSIAKGIVGVNHVFSDSDSDLYYSPSGEMSRKEAAEMLYRMKTVSDNNIDSYALYYKPEPIIKDFVYDEDISTGYGRVTVEGYAEIEEGQTDPRCNSEIDHCESVDYVWFHVVDHSNNEFQKFLDSMQGNSFVNSDKVGLGCVFGEDQIVYYNSSEHLGLTELTMDQSVADAILASESDNPVSVDLIKYLLIYGSGAPQCYSHFTGIEL